MPEHDDTRTHPENHVNRRTVLAAVPAVAAVALPVPVGAAEVFPATTPGLGPDLLAVWREYLVLSDQMGKLLHIPDDLNARELAYLEYLDHARPTDLVGLGVLARHLAIGTGECREGAIATWIADQLQAKAGVEIPTGWEGQS